MQAITVPQSFLLLPRQHGIEDDFCGNFVTGDQWSSVLTDSGTAVIADQAGGVIALTCSDGTVADNDEAYLKSTKETFLFANNKPLEFIARVTWAEQNTDDANVWVGMKDAIAANSILDDGGGPAASYSGAGFFKVDGGTAWYFETSLGGTQTTTLLSITTPNHATTGWQTLKIVARSRGSTVVEITPYIDIAGGQNFVQCRDTNGNQVKHYITLGNPTEMQVGAGAKNGGANNEVLYVDYLACYQLR